MALKTYSFQDITCSFSNTIIGIVYTPGSGLGSISVSMADDVTSHQRAADGGILSTKNVAKNGTVSLSILQTSDLHRNLLNWYTALMEPSNLNKWSEMQITIESKNLGEKIVCTRVAPQKRPDISFEAQGKEITWAFLAEEITHTLI